MHVFVRLCCPVAPVISSWKAHEPNPHAKPGPDFKAMNKLAADSGLVSSGAFRTFRYARMTCCGAGILLARQQVQAGRAVCVLNSAPIPAQTLSVSLAAHSCMRGAKLLLDTCVPACSQTAVCSCVVAFRLSCSRMSPQRRFPATDQPTCTLIDHIL